MSGKQVLSLVNEWQSRGTHVITANLSTLKSGFYLGRLTNENNSKEIKVIIAK